MQIELRYFRGTGNSFKILHTCAELFGSEHKVNIPAKHVIVE